MKHNFDADNFILGQTYFNQYYTVFDQTPTTEDGKFTNQIAFGESNKLGWELDFNNT